MLVFAVVGLGYPVNDSPNAQERSADTREQPEPQKDPVDLAPLQDSINRVTSAIEALKDNPEAEAEKKRAADDLNAQEDMAKWAFWMFVANSVSVLLTAVGIVLIWRTLVYTARAAEHSKEMALSAAEATKAARQQADVAERSHKMMERPYIIPSGVHRVTRIVKGRSKGNYAVVYTIGNYGRSPAIVHYVYSTFGPEPLRHPGEPGSGVRTFDHDGFNTGDVIPAESMQPGTHNAVLPGAVVVAYDERNKLVLTINGQTEVFLAIHAKFEDFAGVIRTRRSTWRYDQGRQRFLRYGGEEYNFEREYKREALPR